MRVEPCSISLSAEHIGELDRLGSRFAIHLDRHGALTEPDSEIVAFVDLVEAELECRHHGKNVYEEVCLLQRLCEATPIQIFLPTSRITVCYGERNKR